MTIKKNLRLLSAFDEVLEPGGVLAWLFSIQTTSPSRAGCLPSPYLCLRYRASIVWRAAMAPRAASTLPSFSAFSRPTHSTGVSAARAGVGSSSMCASVGRHIGMLN